VLTTFLNLFEKVGAGIAVLGFSSPAKAGLRQTCTPQQGNAPGSKVLAQKTNVNHAHRRGYY
jgi:hypothetical protein